MGWENAGKVSLPPDNHEHCVICRANDPNDVDALFEHDSEGPCIFCQKQTVSRIYQTERGYERDYICYEDYKRMDGIDYGP